MTYGIIDSLEDEVVTVDTTVDSGAISLRIWKNLTTPASQGGVLAQVLLTPAQVRQLVKSLTSFLTDHQAQTVAHCAMCGGTNVLWDAFVAVNDHSDLRLLDDVICEDCGMGVRLSWS